MTQFDAPVVAGDVRLTFTCLPSARLLLTTWKRKKPNLSVVVVYDANGLLASQREAAIVRVVGALIPETRPTTYAVAPALPVAMTARSCGVATPTSVTLT